MTSRHPGWCATAHSAGAHVGRSVRCWSSADMSIVTWIEQRGDDRVPMLILSVITGDGSTLLRFRLDQAVALDLGMRAAITRTEGTR